METFYTANVEEADGQLARGLGWFGIGLGLTQILAPGSLARLIGVTEDHKGTLRAFGVREIATGVGILSQRRPDVWLWSRVAGDALDLTFLLRQMGSPRSKKGRLAVATAAVLGVSALDVICSQRFTRSGAKIGNIHVEKSITIGRSPEELYNIWHNFEDLPRFMNHLLSVKRTGENRWHWVARGPARLNLEWDANIVDEKSNEYIAWRSLEGADVENAGAVYFAAAPGGRGTVVRVVLDYLPPAGILGAQIAKLFGEEPEMQLNVDLHRFKQMMETGEIPTTSGQPAGRSRSTSWKFDRSVRK